MAAGTITATHGSATIVGENTAFLSAVKSGDFILITVGGASYFLPVLDVESDTVLTLAAPYDGSTTNSLAWDVVAKGALASVPVGLIAESARALRAQNLDKDNWQKVFSVDDEITVTLVDGSQYKGVSWLKASKAINAANVDLILKTAGEIRTNTEIATNAADAATSARDVAQTAQASAKAANSTAQSAATNASNSAAAAEASKVTAAESESKAIAANKSAQAAKTEVAASAAAAANSATSAEESDKAAAASKSAAASSATAAASSSQSAGMAQKAAESAKVAAESANDKAQAAQTAAAKSATEAAGSAGTASAQASQAVSQANLAKQYADSLNADLMMKKASNLSDVASPVEARKNLGVIRLDPGAATRTVLRAADDGTGAYFQLDKNGAWGVYNYDKADGAGWEPLGVDQGGTGANTKEGALDNLGILGNGKDRAASAPADANRITLNGVYGASGAGATNYADAYSPVLHMSRYSGSGQAQLQIQSEGIMFYRGAASQGGTWSSWRRGVTTEDEAYYPWNHEKVSACVTFPNCASASYELMVKVAPTYIHIVGIIRTSAAVTGQQVKFRVIKAPAAQSQMYCPYQMVLASGGHRGGYTEAAYGIGASITFNHGTTADSWVMVNHTITFN
ncbi:hypothetical protein CYD30_23535 [Kosakonia cowanii]|nr:hypothetical protein CYD30_23535 [Kosakonia cowanii]